MCSPRAAYQVSCGITAIPRPAWINSRTVLGLSLSMTTFASNPAEAQRSSIVFLSHIPFGGAMNLAVARSDREAASVCVSAVFRHDYNEVFLEKRYRVGTVDWLIA